MLYIQYSPAKQGNDMDAKPIFIEHLVQREQGKLYVRDYAGAGPAFV
jgi:hypothetical protein